MIRVVQTLRKKNTKHDPTYCPNEKKMDKGIFGFTFDTRPDKETEGKAMRLEWSKKEDNNYTEKWDHVVSVNYEKIKERDFVDIEDYFQMEVVEGETVFVCNICNEGLDNEMEITKHIKDNPEILLSDNSYTDSELYEGFGDFL